MEDFVKLYTWKEGNGLWLHVKHRDNDYWYCVVQNNGTKPLCGIALLASTKEEIAVKEKKYTFIANLADVWKETWKL